MNIKPLFYTSLVASIVTFVYIRTRKRLSLVYENNTGRLVIMLKHRFKCCEMLAIEKIVININGEDIKTLHYKPGEKIYDGPMIIDLPEAEGGDYIRVKLTSRCSRQFVSRGNLELF